ncbi:MAG TPA: hypothetical protein VL172_19000, partial [Kofleriaceae bacterium]|nr:hypothetical protein [Kofleriaceae bacterium]
MAAPMLPLANAAAAPLAAVPEHAHERFHELLIDGIRHGRRLSALFAHPVDGRLQLFAVLAADADGLLELARTTLAADRFPSLTPELPEAHLFEREIAEQWGALPEGHPW